MQRRAACRTSVSPSTPYLDRSSMPWTRIRRELGIRWGHPYSLGVDRVRILGTRAMLSQFENGLFPFYQEIHISYGSHMEPSHLRDLVNVFDCASLSREFNSWVTLWSFPAAWSSVTSPDELRYRIPPPCKASKFAFEAIWLCC